MTDTAQEILEQLKKHEAQLSSIAINQEQILAVEQKRLTTERLQMFTGWAKLVVIVLITWVSFIAAQKMLSGLTQNMGGLLGGTNSMELGGATDLADQLKGSSELMREIMGR